MYKVLQTETFRKWFKRLRDDIAKFAIGQRIGRIKNGNFGDSKSVGDNILNLGSMSVKDTEFTSRMKVKIL